MKPGNDRNSSAKPPGPALFKLVLLGLIRDPKMRRNTMFFIVLAALILLFFGATFFHQALVARPFVFILYWAACAWLTFCAVLLALYDLLVMRIQRRVVEKTLAAELAEKIKAMTAETDRIAKEKDQK